MKVLVRDFIARRGYRPVRWDLWSVELATKSDITQSTMSYRMEPPAVKGYERSHAEQAWWRNALPCLCELIRSVQTVQFAKTPNQTFESWQKLPLIIWAKPIYEHPPTNTRVNDWPRAAGRQWSHASNGWSSSWEKKDGWATAHEAGDRWKQFSGKVWESGGSSWQQ